ncbi:hypothetical protein, partial [Christiangramia aquimixticola]|uniref:hypothetical protein n=1 Tax=Christiangramia aquimixticola TaxID=1697558 RepID=UPI003AA9361E
GASDGMFMAGTDTAGTYTYTVDADGDGPCPADSEDVVVTVNTANDAGTGSPLTICSDDSTDYNLRDYLTGEDDGGTWTGPDGASDGMF